MDYQYYMFPVSALEIEGPPPGRSTLEVTGMMGQRLETRGFPVKGFLKIRGHSGRTKNGGGGFK